ncbi:MAG: acetyl/propionyl/methylcrotonyl-CoA carboxylase subunit alpha [Pseudomonadota bacterium]
MFSKILIANRGEIACRVIKTARRMGVRTVAVYSDADAQALHVEIADEAVHIGPAPARESYLKIDALIDAALSTGAQAIHPGYGFLSENPDFVEAVEAAGLTFIGPSADAIRKMGLKDAAKRLMEDAGVSVVPGYHGPDQDPAFLAAQADTIGYPVLIKASAGGGGKGMRRVDGRADFDAALTSAKREALAAFGNDHCLIEKYVAKPRHIEVQVFADGARAVHLFERDCSLQRRHQKVIEEAPAPGMTPEMRDAMGQAAVRAAEAIGYKGAGTVEFIVDASDGLDPGRFYFMEMNTRLQVEHPVTEAITGHDLVEWQLRVAAGAPLPVAQGDLAIDGHAFEARIYAEDASRNFLPATGQLAHLSLPDFARCDTGVRSGDRITPFYDPMIAKVIVHGATRGEALSRLRYALAATQVAGTVTNVAFLAALARHHGLSDGDVDTGLIARDLDHLTAPLTEPPEARMIAAVAALRILDPLNNEDLWGRLIGWRLWGNARQFALIEAAGERLQIPVQTLGPTHFHVEIGGEEREIWIWGPMPKLTVELDGRRQKVTAIRHDRALTVFFDCGAFTFGLPDPLAIETEEQTAGDDIAAPMTGAIKAVYVLPGSQVAKGDALVVMEAMKMEHTLSAPRDGQVAEVNARLGDQIDEGAILVRLEPATTDG